VRTPIGIFLKLNSIQIDGAVTNSPADSNRFIASRWKEFDLNLRSQRNVCHGEHAHPHIAEIDTESVQRGGSGEYLHRSVQQLPFAAASVLFECAFQHHP